MTEPVGVIIQVVTLVAVSLLVAFMVAHARDKYWQQECIKNNVAGYNSKTGAWEWQLPAQPSQIESVQSETKTLPRLQHTLPELPPANSSTVD